MIAVISSRYTNAIGISEPVAITLRSCPTGGSETAIRAASAWTWVAACGARPLASSTCCRSDVVSSSRTAPTRPALDWPLVHTWTGAGEVPKFSGM